MEGVKGGSALSRPLNSSDWKAFVDMVENKDADLRNTNLSRCENRDPDPVLKRGRLSHPELSQIATAPEGRRDLLLENVNVVTFG